VIALPRTMRFEPTDIRVSLLTATVPFMYLDSGATNGVYPAPAAFRAMIEGANPGLLSGACSAITHMSAGVMQFTDAQGIQAIKEAGGITIAQDVSAHYADMPRNAVATGAVDFVLPPEEIAEQLSRLGAHLVLRCDDPAHPPSTTGNILLGAVVFVSRS